MVPAPVLKVIFQKEDKNMAEKGSEANPRFQRQPLEKLKKSC